MLDLRDISLDTVNNILGCRYINKTFTNKTLINLFLENSTRTQISFEIAAKNLGMKVVNFNTQASSLAKDESTISTVLTLNSYTPDILVVRSSNSTETKLLASFTDAKVINAGDGTNEHPTQALIDLLTITEHFGVSLPLNAESLKGLKIGICGDILHSRVARSNIFLLSKLGAKIILISHPVFLPSFLACYYKANFACEVFYSLSEIIEDLDVLMMLRFQKERSLESGGSFKSICFSASYSKRLKKDAIILHPGPINEGVEILYEIAYGSCKSKILKQVENGLKIRQSLISFLLSQA